MMRLGRLRDELLRAFESTRGEQVATVIERYQLPTLRGDLIGLFLSAFVFKLVLESSWFLSSERKGTHGNN